MTLLIETNSDTLMKLINGVRAILSADLQQLQNEAFMTQRIRDIGLFFDPRGIYGVEGAYVNEGEGLHQIPAQFAKFLIHLSRYHLGSAVEIGTATGWTACVLAAYLSRFNPQFHLLTVDPRHSFATWQQAQETLPISYVNCTSAALQHLGADLCFIDGNHDYSWVRDDYDNLGHRCALCAFHDIVDENCARFAADGSVPRFWGELKAAGSAQFYEFTDPVGETPIMGIGLRER